MPTVACQAVNFVNRLFLSVNQAWGGNRKIKAMSICNVDFRRLIGTVTWIGFRLHSERITCHINQKAATIEAASSE